MSLSNPFIFILFSIDLTLCFTSCVCFILFMLYVFFNRKKKNIGELINVYFQDRSLMSRIKLYSLTVFVLIPNYVVIYTPPFVLWIISFSIVFILSEKFKLLYLVLIVKLYYTLVSFFFGILYEKSITFSSYINRVFFDNDKKTALFVLHFFFGNMFSRASKLASTSIALGVTYHTQLSHECTVTSIQAGTNVKDSLALAKQMNNGTLLKPVTAEDIMRMTSFEQKSLLSQQPLHGFQESLVSVKDGVIKIIEVVS